MTSRFDANKKRHLVWWEILLFAILIIGFLVILFPPKLFIQSLMNNPVPSEVSVSYLKSLIAKDKNNIPIKIVLAEQLIKLGQVAEAKSIIQPYVGETPKTEQQWNLLFVFYEIMRIETFAMPLGSAQRVKNTKILQSLLPALMRSPYLTAEQAGVMAEDSLAFDFPQLAGAFYKIAIQKNINRPAHFYAQAGQAMLFIGDYQSSADFYLIAMKRSTALTAKRKYYIAGVESLVASGVAGNAFAFAKKNIDGLSTDTETLTYLTQLALKASQQNVADEYISRILQLQYRE